MKTTLKFAVILFLLAIQHDLAAQVGDISKSELLGAMNSFDGLDLSAEEENKLRETNTKVVDNIFGIANSDADDKNRLEKLKSAKSINDKLFEDVLDAKKLKKYRKKVKKELRPFKRKAKFVKFLI